MNRIFRHSFQTFSPKITIFSEFVIFAPNIQQPILQFLLHWIFSLQLQTITPATIVSFYNKPSNIYKYFMSPSFLYSSCSGVGDENGLRGKKTISFIQYINSILIFAFFFLSSVCNNTCTKLFVSFNKYLEICVIYSSFCMTAHVRYLNPIRFFRFY